ncbi:hypothetical protein GF324_04545, partial [bacterium]|nr:hypothetical protein [bacterium]
MSESGEKKAGKRLFFIGYPALPLLLLAALTAGAVFLFPHQSAFRYSEYNVGSISREEIIAPFTFEILKSDAELAAERENARENVLPVYMHVDTVRSRNIEQLTAVMNALRELGEQFPAGDDAYLPGQRDSLFKAARTNLRLEHGVEFSPDSWQYIKRHLEAGAMMVDEGYPAQSSLQMILQELYSRGILNKPKEKVESRNGRIRLIVEGEERTVDLADLFDPSDARNEALGWLQTTFRDLGSAEADSAIKAGFELLVPFITPNVMYAESETQARRREAEAKTPVVKGIVLKDERIIDSNEKITEKHIEILRSMEVKRMELAAEASGFLRLLPWFGRVL